MLKKGGCGLLQEDTALEHLLRTRSKMPITRSPCGVGCGWYVGCFGGGGATYCCWGAEDCKGVPQLLQNLYPSLACAPQLLQNGIVYQTF